MSLNDREQLRRVIALRNLERLSSKEPPAKPKPELGAPQYSCKVVLSLLKSWSAANDESIEKSKAKEVFNAKNPLDFDIAFLPFMESMAVYLRDYGLVHEAWTKHRQYQQGGSQDQALLEDALATYFPAQDQIDELAKIWGMEFHQICDLPDHSPAGEPHWDGPYCGAFVTTEAQADKPFMGLAFKGTSPFNYKEIDVDVQYQMVPGPLAGPQDWRVSEGVCTGLYGTFDASINPPFKDICASLEALSLTQPNTKKQPIRLHVTGHSLGGSYATLAFAMLNANGGPNGIGQGPCMGDEYTFGAPRIGDLGFADFCSGKYGVSEGRCWRIVNNKDIVPQVPPAGIKGKEDIPFYHIDDGVMIFKDQAPKAMESERGKPPPAGIDYKNIAELIAAVRNSLDHCMSFPLAEMP